ncbi:MAG TPA: hypothetical protein VMF11_13990 [Candidatus Baltobacteraceae bacterium]|nr:hypothetical protein [Candidatus Baltobacteraceae bacterium]
MTTTVPTHAVRAAFEHLIDYAGLFPPALLAVEEALEEYDRARAGAQAWMLGRFVIPVSRLAEIRDLLAGRERVALSVIAAPEAFELVAEARNENWAEIAALEVPLGDLTIAECAARAKRAGLRELPSYVELPRGAGTEELTNAMEALAAWRLGAKLRCGGVEPEAYPSIADVAAFLVATQEAGTRFKATAGLHHPVRHFNREIGVSMHGFLNLLAAAAFAPHVDRSTLEAIVGEEDPDAFELGSSLRWRDQEIGAGELAVMRSTRFVGYGSCSFTEPVEDLRALEILPPG